MDSYFQLAKYILPAELFTHFELCRVEEVCSELHLYLVENNFPPDSDVPLHPNFCFVLPTNIVCSNGIFDYLYYMFHV